MFLLEVISSLFKVVMFLTTCYLFYVGLKFRNKENLIFTFWYLCIFSLIDSLLYLYFVIISNEINSFLSISKWTQLVYIFIEFFIISNFLFEINNIRYKKNLIKVISFISILVFCVTFINKWNFKEYYYTIITLIEFVFINILGIRYLLIISPYILDQKSKEVSIIVKGIFLFINISSPYFIIIQFISNEPNSILSSLSFISDIAYTIFFSYLIKSLQCNYKK